jgi:putative transposase
MRRIYLPGVSVHVIRRGNNRMSIFGDDEDREVFLTILRWAAEMCDLWMHALVLMTNHFHFIATPQNEKALPKTMKRLGERYARHFNRKRGRSGTIWGARHRALLITDEVYFLTCLRYVEQNPVRAQMVSRPEAYRWSTYGVHALGEPSGWLVPHAVYLGLGSNPEERQAAYRALCGAMLTEAQLASIRYAEVARPQRQST